MSVRLKILIMTTVNGGDSAYFSQDSSRIISTGGKGPVPELLLVGAQRLLS